MLMVATEFNDFRVQRSIEQSIARMRHAESMITEAEFEKRKRARKAGDKRRKRNRMFH